jgi:hypothetical protein
VHLKRGVQEASNCGREYKRNCGSDADGRNSNADDGGGGDDGQEEEER